MKIVHGNGATVPVTEVIAYLGAEGETVETGATPAAAEVAQATADLKAAGLKCFCNFVAPLLRLNWQQTSTI